MSAVDNTKPPRPCTEYNIFFQLERAYILQVLLYTQPSPSLDPTAIFHPSQQTYTRLPPLPRRYASLILPYDWHLPGKEKRRKRKHRKSHGAIGFKDLSTKIVYAWKFVDDEVKSYCSQVCAAGVVRYKAGIQEWKRREGQQVESRKNYQHMIVKIVSHESSMQEPINSNEGKKKKPEDASSSQHTLKTLIREDAHFQDVTKIPIPTPVLSRAVEVPMEKMNQAFESDIFLGDAFVEMGMWDAQEESLTLEPALAVSTDVVPSTNFVVQSQVDFKNHNQDEDKVLRNPSIVSNIPVDINDNEIFDMWNNVHIDNNDQYCNDYTPTTTTFTDNTSNTTTHHVGNEKNADLQYHSMFGLNGYTKTMQDMQRMKVVLEQQMAELEKVKRRERRSSAVACSA